MPQDLNSVHDDILAFAQGVGLRRFPGYIPEEMPSVLWEGENPEESWKDFIELARAAGAALLIINTSQFDASELEFLAEDLHRSRTSRTEDFEMLRELRQHVGRIGAIQLGFPQQGVIFVCELTTPWYESYKVLQEVTGELADLLLDSSTDRLDEDER